MTTMLQILKGKTARQGQIVFETSLAVKNPSQPLLISQRFARANNAQKCDTKPVNYFNFYFSIDHFKVCEMAVQQHHPIPSAPMNSWNSNDPCDGPSPEDWDKHLYGRRPVPRNERPDDEPQPENRDSDRQTPEEPSDRRLQDGMSIMEAAAYRKLCLFGRGSDRGHVASEHRVKEFTKLILKRKPDYTCGQFEAMCRQSMRRFASRWAQRENRQPLVPGDAPLGNEEEGQFTIFDHLGVDPPTTPTEQEEWDALIARAVADLPIDDQTLVMGTPLGGAADKESQTMVRVAVPQGIRKAKSRADDALRKLFKVHEQTESREGRDRIERALRTCIDKAEDRDMAKRHLLDGLPLDDLRMPSEDSNKIRHRFGRIVDRIFPVIDPERMRALALLPQKQNAAIKAAYFPPCPVEVVAKKLACSIIDVYVCLRMAVADLGIIFKACESVKPGNHKGASELKKKAAKLPPPDGDLIILILINGESLMDVATKYGLTEEALKTMLLNAIKSLP